MGAVAFDTLKFAKRLKEAGFTEQQAEALAALQYNDERVRNWVYRAAS
jgi:precorrin-6B methylase 1